MDSSMDGYVDSTHDDTEKVRIAYLEKELTRLQELCRTNFGVIADLKKKNEQLNEIQLELKETTSDLAYSLAECPYWGTDDEGPNTEALRVLVTYAKNIQYILELPIFVDPMEQLESYGMSRGKALRYLRKRYSRQPGKPYKCPKCKKDFTTEDRKNKHLEFHTNSRKKLHCTQCNRYIDSFRSFKSHLLSHQYTYQMMAFPPIRFISHDLVGSAQTTSLLSSCSSKFPDITQDKMGVEQIEDPLYDITKERNLCSNNMDCVDVDIIPGKDTLEVMDQTQRSPPCHLDIL